MPIIKYLFFYLLLLSTLSFHCNVDSSNTTNQTATTSKVPEVLPSEHLALLLNEMYAKEIFVRPNNGEWYAKNQITDFGDVYEFSPTKIELIGGAVTDGYGQWETTTFHLLAGAPNFVILKIVENLEEYGSSAELIDSDAFYIAENAKKQAKKIDEKKLTQYVEKLEEEITKLENNKNSWNFDVNIELTQKINGIWKTTSADMLPKDFEQKVLECFPFWSKDRNAFQFRGYSLSTSFQKSNELAIKQYFGEHEYSSKDIVLKYEHPFLMLCSTKDKQLILKWQNEKFEYEKVPNVSVKRSQIALSFLPLVEPNKSYLFRGKINNQYDIEMQLTFSDCTQGQCKKIEGKYQYTSKKEILELETYIDMTFTNIIGDEITLKRKKDGETREEFHGIFGSNGRVEGYWDYRGHLECFPFYLELIQD